MSRECRPTINQSLDQGGSFDNTALDRMFSQLFQGSDPRVTARKWPSIRSLVHVFTHRDQFPTLGRTTFFLSSKICFDSRENRNFWKFDASSFLFDQIEKYFLREIEYFHSCPSNLR